MSQAIPLKVKQLGEILMRCPQRDLESIVRVVVHAPGSVGGTPSAAVIGAQFGFDWDSGSLLISTDEKLTRLSTEDVLAINDSVRKGTSWHAYQSWKKQEDRITALEASHLEELRAYELTVSNLRAELESVRQGQCLHQIAEPAAPQAVQAPMPLPLLVRDIARDLEITVQDACNALKPLGAFSTNSAVTAEMAQMLRHHFPAPAHPAEGVPAQAMDALKAAMKADPEYAWSWHCAIWAGAYDEGLETGAANRAAARVMHMAFDCDTTKHEHFDKAHLAATRPTPQGLDARDAFEAVRKTFCKLQRYSFLLDSRGNVRRCADHCGNWVEFEAVHTLFEPQSVDAALAAQAKQGGA